MKQHLLSYILRLLVSKKLISMHDAVKNAKKQKYFDQLLQAPDLAVFNFIIRIENVFAGAQKLKRKYCHDFLKKIQSH